jgi:L-ascorbate metabolism protein UlaG (beta-lactamase superfamily)
MIIFLLIILFLIVATILFMQLPKFGKTPSGERLTKVLASPNFKKGKFENMSHTPDLTEGVSYWSVTKEFFFAKRPRRKPTSVLPSAKTDLLHLPANEDVLVWFGHSSYFMQIDGKKILVDPVLSGAASPLAFTTPSFAGTDIYSTDELPSIDYLFLTHDHWDHLDYTTIMAMKPKTKLVICSLGTGAHLERWGFNKNSIIEKDWDEQIILDKGFKAHTTTARHFSGRGFKRNQALWTSFVLQTPSMQIFIGGDSGYDSHFTAIGEKFGAFDLVILENGQYDKSWKYIHMMPDEVLQAAKDLNAKNLLAVHSAKFAIANHAWDEPLQKISALHAGDKQVHLLTPMIGERVNLKAEKQVFAKWWEGID